MPAISTGSGLPPAVAESVTGRRKRSSSTHTPHNSSGSIGSVLVYPVPDSVAWLEQLTLRVSVSSLSDATKRKPRDTIYVLHADHTKAKLTWSHTRPFDDYRSFQHRLQKALRHGHFCDAECPWLYSFVKSHFPKSYALGDLVSPTQAMRTRREALERFIRTLQTFLINRQNHCCSVLTVAVADEVLAFINGDEGKAHQGRLAPTPASSEAAMTPAIPSLPRRSWDSNGGAASDPEKILTSQDDRDESENYSSSTAAEDDEICRLCDCHLGDEADSPTERSPMADSEKPESPVHAQMSPVPEMVLPATLPLQIIPPRRGSSQSRASLSRPHFYTTQLACGHRFHDECIVPVLNESMSCPVCGREERR
jgi:hypothetical protein